MMLVYNPKYEMHNLNIKNLIENDNSLVYKY